MRSESPPKGWGPNTSQVGALIFTCTKSANKYDGYVYNFASAGGHVGSCGGRYKADGVLASNNREIVLKANVDVFNNKCELIARNRPKVLTFERIQN
jgi:hypothetical protein